MKATVKAFLAAMTIGLGANQAMAGMVDFESLGTGAVDGDIMAFTDEGVTFSTGSVSNSVVQGNPLPFTESSTQISLSASGIFNLPGSARAGLVQNGDDILMTFVDPGTTNPTSVSMVSLTTDDQNPDSGADIVRLIALDTNGNVLAFDQATDDDPNGTTLTVDVGTATITHAIFQTTTSDFEGYDNIEFSGGGAPIPEPSSVAMLGAGLLLIGYGNRRKKFRI